MADTAALLAEAAALLAERGIPVERYPGYRTRGKSRLRPQVHVEHDTADPEPLSRRRMLDLLANGHGSLRNALCTWAVPRKRPAAVLIAARTAWHAGRGSWDGVSGNSRATGTEIQRAQGQTVTAEQWEIAAEITRVEIEVFGPLEVVRVCTHNEWTPRKTDPQGLSGATWRDRLTRTPAPEPHRRREEHAMRQGDTDDDFGARVVTDWQHFCNRFLYETHPLVVTHPDLRHVEAMAELGGTTWESEGVRGSNLEVDGVFGPATRGASWQVIVRTGHILGHSVPGRADHYGQDDITATVQSLAATALERYRRDDMPAAA